MTASIEAAPPRRSFPRRRRTGVIGSLKLGQVLTLGLAGAILLLGVLIGGLDGVQYVALPVLALVGVALFPTRGGRSALFTLVLGVLYMARKQAGQTTYRQNIAQFRPRGQFQLPGALAPIDLYAEPEFGAITVNPRQGTFTAVLRVSAPGYNLQANDDKLRRLNSYSQLLSSLNTHRGLERIQIMLSAIVTSPRAVREYSDENRDEAASPWAKFQYAQILDVAVRNTAKHETHIVVVLSSKILGKEIRGSGGGVRGMHAVMKQELRAIEHALSDCGIDVEKWLDERELSAVIRQAYDPIASTEIDGRVDEYTGVAPRSAGPTAAEEFWSYVRTDSGVHSTYEITEWPRIGVDPDFLGKIVDMPFRHTLSIIVTPVPLEESMRTVQRDKSRIAANRIQRAKSARPESAMVQAELDDIQRREGEIIAGFGDCEFAGVVTVTAPDADTLRAATTSLELAASQSFIEVRPLLGQQMAAFNVNLPLGLHETPERKSWMQGLL